MEIKTCTKCREPQALINFYVDRRVADGRTGICKSCVAHRRQQRKSVLQAMDECYHKLAAKGLTG